MQLVPGPDPTARKRTQRTPLGVANRGDTAPGQDNDAADLAVWNLTCSAHPFPRDSLRAWRLEMLKPITSSHSGLSFCRGAFKRREAAPARLAVEAGGFEGWLPHCSEGVDRAAGGHWQPIKRVLDPFLWQMKINPWQTTIVVRKQTGSYWQRFPKNLCLRIGKPFR